MQLALGILLLVSFLVFIVYAAKGGNLMMGLALPLLVLAVCWGREMFRHSPHFVYKSAQKTEDMVTEEQSEKKTEKTEKND